MKKTYRGFNYVVNRDTYDVYDYTAHTHQAISVASGSGYDNPERKAHEVIDQIIITCGGEPTNAQ